MCFLSFSSEPTSEDTSRWAFIRTDDNLNQTTAACQNDSDYYVDVKNSDGGTTVMNEDFSSEMDIVDLSEDIVEVWRTCMNFICDQFAWIEKVLNFVWYLRLEPL